MNIKLIYSVIAMIVIIFASFTHATIITAGSLSHDTGTDVVSDSLGLDWHVLDYNNIKFGDGSIATLVNTRLAIGGDLFGWEIATQANYYQMLKNAGGTGISADLLDGNTTSNVYTSVNMNNSTSWFDMFKLGQGWTVYDGHTDYFLVNQSNSEVFLEKNIRWSYLSTSVQIIQNYSYNGARFYNYGNKNRMNIVLSRGVAPKPARTAVPEPARTAVPEPATFAIFALGMIGLSLRRFKKEFK